jgi:Na+:H+ antiporter, NhaA family
MNPLRSERFPAILLLVAAALGLVVANSPVGAAVIDLSHVHLGIPGTAIDLSLSHWISDGLLVVFFFGVSVELQLELTRGELRDPRRAVLPAIAALGGVVLPIVVYLLVTAGSGAMSGWPIPTATDVAFALGVLAVFGRGLPSGIRVFLLALAILDDIVGIVLIAVLFATDLNLGMLLAGVLCAVAFAVVSRLSVGRGGMVVVAIVLVLLALATWAFILSSGVHATIAGVLLGLGMSQQLAVRTLHALDPWIKGLVLPLFAFSAALVAIPAVEAGSLSPAFWGVLVALPVGKLVGISGSAWLGQRLVRGGARMPFADLLAVGALGGIGFTVSLLLAALAFAGDPLVRDEAILGVLAGSAIALVLSGLLVSWRARHYRRVQKAGEEVPG